MPAGDVREAVQDTEAAVAAGDHELCAGFRAVGGRDRQCRCLHRRLHAVGAPHPRLGHMAIPARCSLYCVQHLTAPST